MGIMLSGTDIMPVLVGSRAYNAHKPDSDYDYMFVDSNRDQIIEKCNKMGLHYTESSTTRAIKFEFEGLVYNFIFLSQMDYLAWHDATDIMKIISESLGTEHLRQMSKKRRLSLFGPLVNRMGGEYVELTEGNS